MNSTAARIDPAGNTPGDWTETERIGTGLTADTIVGYDGKAG